MKSLALKCSALSLGLAVALTSPLGAPSLEAATYNWNTTSGTWDTSTTNWTGTGTTWVDGNDAVFANTATASTITLDADRTAGAITIGNSTNNYSYTFTSGSGATLNAASLTLAGSTANDPNTGASNSLFNGSLNLNLSGTITLSRAALEFGGTGTYNVGSIIAGNGTNQQWGTFRMSGSANVTATSLNMAANATTGKFDLNGGTLTVGSITGMDTWSATAKYRTSNTINGATLRASQANSAFLAITAKNLDGNGATSSVYLGSNGVTFDSNGFDIGTTTMFKDNTSSVGTLTKTGSGTLTLSGVNTFTGATTVNNGTLQVNATNGLATSSAIAVNSGATLAMNAADVLGFTPGKALLTINSGTASNTTAASRITLWSGATLTGGVLTSTSTGDANGAFSLSGAVVATSDAGGNAALISGSPISLQNRNITNGAITFNVSRGVLAPASDLIVSANLIPFSTSAGNGITKTGSGVMVLTGSNTYTGATTVSGGGLQLQANGNNTVSGTSAALSPSSRLVMNEGAALQLRADSDATFVTSTFNPSGGSTTTYDVGAISAGANNTLTLRSTNTVGVGGLAGAVMTFNVTGSQNDRLLIAGGDLAFQNFASQTLVLNPTTGNLTVASNLNSGGAITTGTLSLAGSATGNIFSGNISNAAGGVVSVTKANSGTWTLAGSNSYSGATMINGGTLTINGTNSGTGIATVANGAVLNGTGAVAGAVIASGAVSGSVAIGGDLTINDTGSLAGTHALSGNVTLNNSTLANVASDITLASGKTLSGTGGTIGSVAATASNSTVSPGGSSVASLRVGGLALAIGAHLALDINGALAGGADYDRVIAANSVTLDGGDLALTLGTFTPGASDLLFLVINDGGSAVGGAGLFDSVTFAGTGIGTLNSGSAGAEGSTYNINGGLYTLTYQANFEANSFTGGNDIALAVVPEPGTWAMLLGGIGMLGLCQRLRRKPALTK